MVMILDGYFKNYHGQSTFFWQGKLEAFILCLFFMTVVVLGLCHDWRGQRIFPTAPEADTDMFFKFFSTDISSEVENTRILTPIPLIE